jgi:cellulose synthase/poly-beta-1,6-N-acetylglucosamine synthase-like glycosyltransferase
LHDSGGDRTQTVEALPQIIAGLRTRGFQLVRVSELLGLARDAVMPPIPPEAQLSARLTDVGFLCLNWIGATIHYLFLIGIVLGVLRFLFIGALAVSERWRSRHALYSDAFVPSVSVIIPAYNEEKVICQTIRSLLDSDYARCDIVIVDDGSSDDTAQRVSEHFGANPRVHLFTKVNGGKSQALNYGIAQTQADIVVTLDADTVFRRDTVRKLIRHFVAPQVAAVADNAKVGNRINLLTNWQALEYIASQNLDRRAFALLNCISVVPGAVGAWRRELLVRAGGFAEETLAEDADLTLALLRLGYKIDYEAEAMAFTEAPDTVRGFVKQRFRWMYGTLQAVWKHIDTLFRPRYGALGTFAMPNVLIFQILFPLISPVMDLLMLWSLVAAGWARYQHPLDYTTDTLQRVLFYYALFFTLDLLATFVAFLLERKEDWRLLIWLVFQRFLYRQLMYYVAIKSTLTAIRGTIVGWGKLERKATVPLGG